MTSPDNLPTAAFDYALPAAQIAAHPASVRDASRLMVLDRASGDIKHRVFGDIVSLIDAGDVLVLNETRVIPARLLGRRAGGGEAEIVLLHPYGGRTATDDSNSNSNFGAGTDSGSISISNVNVNSNSEFTTGEEETGEPGPGANLNLNRTWPAEWVALVRPGSRLRKGRVVEVSGDLNIEILDVLDDGSRIIRLVTPLPVKDAIYKYGHMPLPPYIDRADDVEDRERYQTVYARSEGSVAAPTAGLHFTPALLDALSAKGVSIARVVLHVGAGTFRPVDVADPADHVMHAEWYEVTEEAASLINARRDAGGRVWAVGTTVTRTLETVAAQTGWIAAGSGWTRLFIRPGYTFRGVDRMITNFHLPRSTLLMLVSAFAGYDMTMGAYGEAVGNGYRFYSYGDAMAVL